MICPRCGDELRRSKKDPTYGLCDNCRKKYKWVEEEYDDDVYDDVEEEEEDEQIILDDDDDEINEDIGESRRLTKRTPPEPAVKKKKKGLKIFLIILAILIIVGIAAFILLGGIDGIKLFNKSQDNTENVQQNDSTDNTDPVNDTNSTNNESDQTTNDLTYNSGTYVVGTDIPAGEYVLIADMTGYFERAADASGEISSISANGNFTTNTIVTISDGEYFIFSGATAYSIDQAPALDTTQQGMFKVGKDIPAGDYTIHSDGTGTVEISSDSTHNINSTLSKEEFQGDKTITVSDGQYLTLTEAAIVQ